MIFFSETNPESPFQHQHKIKKKTKKRISQEAIVIARGSGLVT